MRVLIVECITRYETENAMVELFCDDFDNRSET